MNQNQIKALSDAQLYSGPRQTGLVRDGGLTWRANGSFYDLGHHNNTILWLVNRGYLQLYCGGSIAHITESGVEALADWKNYETQNINHKGERLTRR